MRVIQKKVEENHVVHRVLNLVSDGFQEALDPADLEAPVGLLARKIQINYQALRGARRCSRGGCGGDSQREHETTDLVGPDLTGPTVEPGAGGWG